MFAVVTEGFCGGETGDLSEGERQLSEHVTRRLLGSGKEEPLADPCSPSGYVPGPSADRRRLVSEPLHVVRAVT